MGVTLTLHLVDCDFTRAVEYAARSTSNPRTTSRLTSTPAARTNCMEALLPVLEGGR